MSAWAGRGGLYKATPRDRGPGTDLGVGVAQLLLEVVPEQGLPGEAQQAAQLGVVVRRDRLQLRLAPPQLAQDLVVVVLRTDRGQDTELPPR